MIQLGFVNSSIPEPKPHYSFKVPIKEPFDGYVPTKNVKVGDKIRIFHDFIVTDFDPQFQKIFNDIQTLFLKEWQIAEGVSDNKIRNFLILIRNDTAEVFINIPQIRSHLKIQPSITNESNKKFNNFILSQIHLVGINTEFPNRLVYFFNEDNHWGLYVSLSNSKVYTPMKNHEVMFAFYHSHLKFQVLLHENEKLRNDLFSKGWFPFYRVLGPYYIGLCNAVQNGCEPDSIETEIINGFDKTSILSMKNEWLTNDIFKKNKIFFENGIDKYLESDYFSCIHILYPRIEGMMRFIYLGEKKKPQTPDLLNELKDIGDRERLDTSMLLPALFKKYLEGFYLRGFDVPKNELDLSRHSLAHGVARDSDFTQKRAFQTIMMLDQIFQYIKLNRL